MTTPCLPIILSMLVRVRSLLKYLTAIGRTVSVTAMDTTMQAITCRMMLSGINTARSVETTAPQANQIVVSPMVKSSIATHATRMINQNSTMFIIGSPLTYQKT